MQKLLQEKVAHSVFHGISFSYMHANVHSLWVTCTPAYRDSYSSLETEKGLFILNPEDNETLFILNTLLVYTE